MFTLAVDRTSIEVGESIKSLVAALDASEMRSKVRLLTRPSMSWTWLSMTSWSSDILSGRVTFVWIIGKMKASSLW